jgi:hypothetical protein
MFTNPITDQARGPKPTRRSTLSPRTAPGPSLRGARRFATITALATAAVIGASAGPAVAGTVPARTPGLLGVTPYSSPWASGYAAVPMPGGATAFTHIEDTYTLPALNCTTTPNASVQFRTGIDGISDGTIERVGVSATCADGQPVYTAWYQMIPADPHPIPKFSPPAGDVMHASIIASSGTYVLSLTDVTHPLLHFSVTKSCPACHDSSAQVTVGPEGPGSFGVVKPGKLGWRPADFGAVAFHNIAVTDSAGVNGGLENPGWNTDELIQPIVPHPYTVAGPLPAPYTAFTDTWHP